jgi:hypothetical protein
MVWWKKYYERLCPFGTYCGLQNKREFSTVSNGGYVPVYHWNSVGAIRIYFASRSTNDLQQKVSQMHILIQFIQIESECLIRSDQVCFLICFLSPYMAYIGKWAGRNS